MDKQSQSSGDQKDSQIHQTSEVMPTFVYAFGITFRTKANFTGFLQGVGRGFPTLQLTYEPAMSSGERVAVEFVAQGPEHMLHAFRTELIKLHATE